MSASKASGRAAFGGDPDGYDNARPDYPEWIFETLRSHCGLDNGTSVFEIGAGTGTATRRLLALGASPLLAIEPDPRLARFLVQGATSALRVVNETFEAVELAPSSFDIGVSATAFHWLDEEAALRKIATSLRAGGWWAAFWNIFGDETKADPFHDATKELLGPGSTSPSNICSSRLEFGAEVGARTQALRATGTFENIDWRRSNWALELNAKQAVQLYATFSNVILRPDREEVLIELERIARDQFGGRVVRNMTTMMYLARRTLDGNSLRPNK